MQRDVEVQPAGGTWVWQALSGLALLVLVGLHMIANHLTAPGGLRGYQEVLAYMKSPVIVALELLLLGFGTYHGLLGLRVVITDLGLSRRQEVALNAFLTLVGVVMVGWGAYLTWYLVVVA